MTHKNSGDDKASVEIFERKDTAGPGGLASFSSSDLGLIPHYNTLHNTVLFMKKTNMVNPNPRAMALSFKMLAN